MKFRPTLLLGGAVLVVVAPVWADKIPYPGSAKDPRKFEISIKESGNSNLKVNASVNAEFRTEPTLAGVFTNFPMSADGDVQHAGLDKLGSHDRISLFSRDEMNSQSKGEVQRMHNSNIHVDRRNVASVALAEPGSLSLMLLGLAAVGFLARRRAGPPVAANDSEQFST